MSSSDGGARAQRGRRRRARAFWAVLGVPVLAGTIVVATGSGGSASAPPGGPQPPAAAPAAVAAANVAVTPTSLAKPQTRVVALGDSVPYGTGCDCPTFVDTYAHSIQPGRGGAAKPRNEAVSGATTSDVRTRLERDDVQAEVQDASTVLIMVGANDFSDAFQAVGDEGVSPAKGFAGVAGSVRNNVTAIIKRIRALNGNAHIAVLDYWNTEMDGEVARKSYSAAERSAAAWATRYANEALRQAARSQRVWYVSTFTAFKGRDGKKDPTRYLADDGDHPNAAGHRAIARALSAALPAG